MNDAHDIEELEVASACGPKEPVLDCWLYTRGARRGIGPELATSTRVSGLAERGLHLGQAELTHCLKLWAEHYEHGVPFGQALVHDGLVTVTVTGTELLSAEQLEATDGPHLCMLHEGELVLVVHWDAALSYDETDLGDGALEDQDATTAGAEFATQQVAEKLRAPKPDSTTRVWDVLLDHLDPQHATLDTALALAKLGAFAATQLESGLGASNVLARLRTMAEQRDEAQLLEAAATARAHAQRWASLLWPPDCTEFERRWHLPSVGLAHALEATVLALSLYPNVDNPTLNLATMTTMSTLVGSRWAASTPRLEAALNLRRELAGLSDDVWRALGTSCLADAESEDPRVAHLQATLLGLGRRMPHPEDFAALAPSWLGSDEREAVLSALAASAVRRHHATARPDLAGCDLISNDLVTTVLVGRSLFES